MTKKETFTSEENEDVETEEESEETTESEESEEESEESEETKPDYEAELVKEQARREAAEKAAADTAFKLREEKRKKEEEGLEPSGEQPVTASQLQGILHEERERDHKERNAELIDTKVRTLARSDSEAALIIEIHKNRSFPQGLSLDEQLEEAYAIANRKTLMAQNEELKRSLRSKDTKSDDPTSTHREPTVFEKPEKSGKDIEAIKAAGYKWDGKSRVYVKELGGGKKLLYDPKTKKTTRV